MNVSSVMNSAYTSISSGLRINSAADDAAGLSISQKMQSQTRGMEVNQNNMGSMNDLLKTAEGSLSSMHESLGRIRELALQASNGILTDSDRSIIQTEIESLKRGITDVAKNTEFNTIKLLDGSFTDKHTAMNPDGSGKQISITSAVLENLGIDGLDVRNGVVNIDQIDKAIAAVSESRSNIGSATNAFDHAIRNSLNTQANLVNANSRIQDADIAQEITNLKKSEILNQYKMFTQQMMMDQQRSEYGIVDYLR